MANVKFSALPSASTVSQTDILAVVSGGVSKSSTIGNLWEPTAVGNAAYSIAVTDVQVFTSVAFTLPRIWTLPLAASYGAGRILRVVDSLATITSTNTLTLAISGSDTINGAASQILSTAGQAVLLACDGVSRWTMVGQGITTIGNSYQAVTLSAAGNTNSSQGALSTHFMNVAVNAGAGIYTATISLPYTNIAAGDVNSIYLNVAASTNPTVQIYDNTTAGTLLFEWDADGIQTNIVAIFVFSGSAWYLHDAHFFA